jgi:hypothetical protein
MPAAESRAHAGVVQKGKQRGQQRVNKVPPEHPNAPDAKVAQLSHFWSRRQLARDVGGHF